MPNAQPESAQTQLGVPVTIAVLANDTGAGLTIAGYTQPVAGSLTLNPDQSFTYTPTAGFSGVDGFSYTLRDAAGETVSGLVTIAVMAPNAAPVAANDTASAIAGGSVGVPVLANDNDPDDDPLTIVAIESPGHGTVRVEAGGRLRYAPQQGFVGTDSFAYTVSDGRGGTATASVTIRVATPTAARGAVPPRPRPWSARPW